MTNILTTNTHCIYLAMLGKIPDTNWFILSNRFAGRDWQNYYRTRTPNMMNFTVDHAELVGMYLDMILRGVKIDAIVLHDPNDLNIFCNDKLPLYPVIKNIPKIYVFHNSRQTQLRGATPEQQTQRTHEMSQVFAANKILPVAISKWKAETWQIPAYVILPGIDTREFPECWNGVNSNFKMNGKYEPFSVRVCSNFEFRDFMNGYHIGNGILSGIPSIIMGEGNEHLRGQNKWLQPKISKDLGHYKLILQQARFYLGCNNQEYEDWYNLSILEAMAMGTPVVLTYHERFNQYPDYSKYIRLASSNTEYLKERISVLLRDYSFAQEISDAQRGFVEKYFSLSNFINNWKNTLNMVVNNANGK